MCVFNHRVRNFKVAVHGDDFTILGRQVDLDWFRKEIQRKLEVTIRGRLGPGGKDDSKSIRLLNRVFGWIEQGILIEADQRHAELIVRDLELQSSTTRSDGPMG